MSISRMPETKWTLCRGQHVVYCQVVAESRSRWVLAIWCDEDMIKMEILPHAKAVSWYSDAVYAELRKLGFKAEPRPWAGEWSELERELRSVVSDPSRFVH